MKTGRNGGHDMRRQGRWLWLGLLIFAMHANASDSNLSLVMEMGDAPGRVDHRAGRNSWPGGTQLAEIISEIPAAITSDCSSVELLKRSKRHRPKRE